MPIKLTLHANQTPQWRVGRVNDTVFGQSNPGTCLTLGLKHIALHLDPGNAPVSIYSNSTRT